MSEINYTERYALGIAKLAEGEEVWFDHPHVEFCQVSNMGRIRSIPHFSRPRNASKRPYRKWCPGRIQVMTPRSKGYLHTNYGKVHRLVLETFVGYRPKGLQCRHLDGNPANNRLDNLLWGTGKENIADKDRHGSMLRGEKSISAVLKDLDVPEIHRRYDTGETMQQLATHYGVTSKTIQSVLQGKSFKHAQPEVPAKYIKNRDKGKHNRKLTEDDVREIKNMPRLYGDALKKVGDQYGVSPDAIRSIQVGHTWKHVQ